MPNKNGKDNGRRGFGYVGRIQNSGAQRVEAPVSPGSAKTKPTVKTGDDLRAGK